jgi:hypothetical protein
MYHFLRISSYGFKSRIFINGAPVYNNEVKSAIYVKLVIEHWVSPGVNTLSIIPDLGDLLEKDPENSITIDVLFGDGIEFNEIDKLTIPPEEFQNFDTNPLNLTLLFNNRSNAKPLRWLTGERLENSEALFEEVFSLYSELNKTMQSRNIDSMLRIFREKSADMGRTYKQPSAEYEENLRIGFSEKVNTPGYAAWPLNRADLSLKLYADNRLACLETPDGCSPILTYSETENFCYYFDVLVFRPAPEDQLVIIR